MPDDVTLLTVQIRLEKSVDSFNDLLMVTAGLYEIDVLTAMTTSMPFRSKRRLFLDEYFHYSHFWNDEIFFGNRAQIKKFQILSPPDLTIYCTAEWLTLYVCTFGVAWQTISTYDAFERNLELIRSRIVGQFKRLEGTSQKLRQVLMNRATMLIDGLLELPEQELLIVISRIQEARRRLSLVDAEEIPSGQLKIHESDHSTESPSDLSEPPEE